MRSNDSLISRWDEYSMLSLLTLSLCFSQTTKQRIHQFIHPVIHSYLYRPVTNQLINGQPIHPPTPLLNQSITWKLSRGTVRRLTNKLPVLADRLFRRMIPTVYQYQKHTHTQLLQSFSNSSPSDSEHKSSAIQLQQLFS